MSDRKFRVVDDQAVYQLGRKPETVAERAKRLHQEAQVLACEEVELLCQALAETISKAEALRDGGDIFPIGVREQARQLADNIPLAVNTMRALTQRHLQQVTGAPTPPPWARG